MVNVVDKASSKMTNNSVIEVDLTRKKMFGGVPGVRYPVPPVYRKWLPRTFRVLQWYYPRGGLPRIGIFEFLGGSYQILSQKVFLWTEGSPKMVCLSRPSCFPPPPPPGKKRGISEFKVDTSRESVDSGYPSSTSTRQQRQTLDNPIPDSHRVRLSGFLDINPELMSPETTPTNPDRPSQGKEFQEQSADLRSDHLSAFTNGQSSLTPTLCSCDLTGCNNTTPPITGLPVQVPQIDNKYLFVDPDHIGIVGKGAYGCVSRAIYQTSSITRSVAVKAFIKGQTSPGQVLLEARILTLLNATDFIPVFYGITPTPEAPRLALVQEFYGQGTTLLTVINSHTEIPNDMWVSVSLQLAVGLREIHNKGVLINDIKDDNVLVDNNFVVKYIDFGFATYKQGKMIHIPEEAFDRYPHIAPEVRLGQRTAPSSDIYSLGVMLESIMAEGMIQDMWDVVSSCIDEDPARRPEVEQLVSQLRYIMEGLEDIDSGT